MPVIKVTGPRPSAMVTRMWHGRVCACVINRHARHGVLSLGVCRVRVARTAACIVRSIAIHISCKTQKDKRMTLKGTHVHMRTLVNIEKNGIAKMPTLAAAWAARLVDDVGDAGGCDCASAQSPSPGWQSGPVAGQAAPDPLCAAVSLHVRSLAASQLAVHALQVPSQSIFGTGQSPSPIAMARQRRGKTTPWQDAICMPSKLHWFRLLGTGARCI